MPGLQRLTLDHPVAHALFDKQHFPHLPALRQLTVHVTCEGLPCLQHLASTLAAAVSLGVTVGLSIGLPSHSEAVWQVLHQVLRGLPCMAQLDMSADVRRRVNLHLHAAASPVSCRQLMLQALDCSSAEELLRQLKSETVLCQIEVSRLSGDSAVLHWAAISVRPGVFVLNVTAELQVIGCKGSLPDLPQGWALVVRLSEQGSVSGLPWDELRPGPRGCLVWRNAAVTVSDTQLGEALDRLL